MKFNLKNKNTHQLNQITAPANGRIIRLYDIPDMAFSHKLIGDGLAIEITNSEIYAPCSGIITIIAPTGHAFGIQTPEGANILVHLGLYFDKPDADNYQYHIKVGNFVTRDTLVVTISKDLLQAYNHKIITPIVVCNYQVHPLKTVTTASLIKCGKTLYTIK